MFTVEWHSVSSRSLVELQVQGTKEHLGRAGKGWGEGRGFSHSHLGTAAGEKEGCLVFSRPTDLPGAVLKTPLLTDPPATNTVMIYA